MTPPPPASPGLRAGNREMRRRAPVSDRPGASPGAAGSSLPARRVLLSLPVQGAVFCAGTGWAAETHAVCVMDLPGKVVSRFTVAHSAEGPGRPARKLAGLGDPADVPAAIERPSGALAGALPGAGHPVVPVSPNAIKTRRESEVLSGARSDPGDAEVIAEYPRLRRHRLRTAAPYSGQTRALRTVTRTRDDVAGLRAAAVNQPGALPDAHWPGGKAIFADLESRIALEFPARYPTAAPAAHLTGQDIAAFCRQTGYSGKRPAAVLPAPAVRARQQLRRRAVRRGPGRRAGAGRRRQGAHRGDQGPGQAGGRPARRAPGRGDLHVAAKAGPDQRRPDTRRAGRLPPSLRRPGPGRRAGRRHPGHQGVRQAPRRPFPPGVQQALPQRGHHVRRQQPPRQPPGPLTSAPRHGRAARTTRTRSASWPVPGSASSGRTGPTARRTTPTNTVPRQP